LQIGSAIKITRNPHFYFNFAVSVSGHIQH
jgi:hypothetical protein